MTSDRDLAKRPVSILAGPYGHPTHPILVPIPIGAWAASLLFDIAAQSSDDAESLAKSSRGLIAIGTGGALLAAVPGFLDYLAIPKGTKAKTVALTHMVLNLTTSATYMVNLRWRRSLATKGGRGVDTGPMKLSAISLAALGVSGYLGGKLAYGYGVRVADEDAQAKGFGG
ncbi:MAG: DUF2231 domain-containing protein [Propionibacteriales bacterium]|nr:DUF2231 domain-containing protein [Propionibacteriales bacterium]